jgi:cell division protein FtsW (lipid II flippase)
LEFLREVFRYPEYNPPGTPASALATLLPGIGQRLGILISALSAIVLIIEWFLGRHSRGNKFIWVASLTLVLGQWVNIQTDPGNFIIMFPAIILVFRMVEDRWKNIGQWILIGYLSLLFFVPWLIFVRTIDFGYQPVQSPVLFFPVPIMIIVGLYWVRWWVENPVKNILNS